MSFDIIEGLIYKLHRRKGQIPVGHAAEMLFFFWVLSKDTDIYIVNTQQCLKLILECK